MNNLTLLAQLTAPPAVGCGDLLDLIVVIFIMQLVMAAWLYDLTRKVCKKDTQSKAPSEQL